MIISTSSLPEEKGERVAVIRYLDFDKQLKNEAMCSFLICQPHAYQSVMTKTVFFQEGKCSVSNGITENRVKIHNVAWH